MSSRTKGREHALQILYQADATSTDPCESMALFWKTFSKEEETTQKFTEEIVLGVKTHRKEIDEAIQKTSTNWRLDRMPRVDRNVLGIALLELLHNPEVPAPVVINEAIELGKRFGAEESGAFINGVLDCIAQEMGRTT